MLALAWMFEMITRLVEPVHVENNFYRIGSRFALGAVMLIRQKYRNSLAHVWSSLLLGSCTLELLQSDQTSPAVQIVSSGI